MTSESTTTRVQREPSTVARRLWVGVVLAAALAPRTYRLSWGLPDYIFPDSYAYFVEPAARLALGHWIPETFIHPPLLVYVLGAVDFGWSLVSGQPIPATPKQSPAALYDLALLGRIVGVVLATASVAILYFLARRLVGTRSALLAAAAFALSPVHVLESHRVNPDGPMILFGLLAAHQAVMAADRSKLWHLYAGFAFAGAAAATKYTGLSAVTVPVCVALGWTGASFRGRLRLCLVGGSLMALVIAVALLPAAFDPEGFWKVIEFHIRTGYREGSTVSAQGWPFSSYARFLLVLAPFAMGWPVYLLSIGGLGVLAAHERRALAIVFAAVVPFLVVQAGAVLAPPRWCQPIVPYLCLSAGVLMDRVWRTWPRIGVAIVVITAAYTATLTASQCARLGLGPQRSLASWLQERTSRAAADGLVVAYPSAVLRHFDPLDPMLKSLPVKVVYTEPMQRRLSSRKAKEGMAPASESETLELHLRWLDEENVDFIIMPSVVEALIPARLGQHQFYRRVVDGSLGFEPAAEFRTTFFTESLYVWADPGMDTHWATGVNGYRVFAPARRELGSATTSPARDTRG